MLLETNRLTRCPTWSAARFAQWTDDGLRAILREWLTMLPHDVGLRREIEKELARRQANERK